MDKNIRKFLNSIARIESNSGQNTNHELIQYGPMAGQKAIGFYGLLPRTANEMIREEARVGHPSPALQQLMSSIQQADPEDRDSIITSHLVENPNLQDEIAEQLAKHVLNKQHGDVNKAAYAWNQGHNLTPEAIEERGYLEHPYVQKFQGVKKAMRPKSIPPAVPQLEEEEDKNLIPKNITINDAEQLSHIAAAGGGEGNGSGYGGNTEPTNSDDLEKFLGIYQLLGGKV